MPEVQGPRPEPQRRSRYKRPSYRLTEDAKAEIVRRVRDFYKRDLDDRSAAREIRVQREAKLRGWVEPTDFPWEGASNVPLGDLLEKSLREQDMLVNNATGSAPVVQAKAVNDADRPKEQALNSLLHHQLFVEQPGDIILGELAQAFTDDGVCTALVVQVCEYKDVGRTVLFPAIPDNVSPGEYFAEKIISQFPDLIGLEPKREDDPWDWTVTIPDPRAEFDTARPKKLAVSFYTQTGTDQLEMIWAESALVFEGPRVMPLDYDDVLYPPRSANLQSPGPSNPRGAPHVICVFRPTVAEIRDLHRSGYYDLATTEAVDSMANRTGTPQDDERERFRDDAEGVTLNQPDTSASEHRRPTLLLCFDRYDLDKDGLAEDVVFWVVQETQTLLRARPLHEFFPGIPPRRPFVEASRLPVRGRRDGIGMVEELEGLHDASKALLDQGIDAGVVAMSPFIGYRPLGNINPTTLNYAPYTMMPLNDPARDLVVHKLADGQAAMGALNFYSLLQSQEERVTSLSDMQLRGQAGPGQSSALRTTNNMQMMTAQAAARPARLFARFMGCVTQIYEIMHTYNESFLRTEKQVKLVGWKRPEESPYITVGPRQDILGNFQFSFRSQSLLGSRADGVVQFGQMFMMNPLMLQAGLVTPEGIYRYAVEFGEIAGIEAEDYLQAPTPDAQKVRMTAEEAIGQIAYGLMPDGVPAEFGGWQEHFAKLEQYLDHPDVIQMLGTKPGMQEMLIEYMKHVGEQAIAAGLRQQMAMAAGAGMGAGPGMGGAQPGGRPAGPPQTPSGPPQLSGPGEMMDESLPSAGGGAERP